MKTVTVKLNEIYIKGLKFLVKNGVFPNISEGIRVAIRELLKQELWGNETFRKLTEIDDSEFDL